MKIDTRKNSQWDHLNGFRYAHRGLFHQPRSASRKLNAELAAQAPLWKEDIAAWRAKGKRIVPENSMEAFRIAARHGYGSELDVHLTADGVLAVFHDDTLLRMTGIDSQVEKMTWRELSSVRLLDTSSGIPLLDEVLQLYNQSQLPLVIELKVKGNTSALCRSVMEAVDRYPTLDYCIESFDPRAVLWLRRNRPDVIRGQLTENFTKSRDAVRHWGHLLTFGMWCGAPDLITRPDFISCKFSDRKNLFLQISHRRGVKQVSWIIINGGDLQTVEREGGLGIFEGFVPGMR